MATFGAPSFELITNFQLKHRPIGVASRRRYGETAAVRRGTGDWREAFPNSRGTRALLGVGAVALVAVIPLLWMWLLYASGLPALTVYLGAIALAGLSITTGAAMIRILDEGR